ncbi:C-GCAxxG-C-C family protein [Telmatospirillum siberiense]|uniref:Uncharacterized protein n=1 Tax=Telmatospirillum siberiense TaxID=382514 RepID=A0A2N3PRW2_9PROT|nr:C-GCAxxG-C-C family protein [Telmatospirillum siberiense]PKU23148.1 hypothetical protein CWS72_18145 [Telmatospirillum siberiense]
MTTRREVLGAFGGAGSALLGSFLCGRAAAAETGAAMAPMPTNAPAVPWPYVKLDPQAVAERAYKGFLSGHCMYGSFYGIIGELAEKKGAPYDNFPFAMMKIGAGGMADWASLCGALNGPALAISLLSSDPKPLVDELFNWYQAAELPDYHPQQKPRVEITTKSVSNSVLCHVSVTRWCEKADVKAFSLDRDERCAWLTASCAKKTVELLNAQADGVFKAAYPIPKEVQECRSCHDKGGKLENTRGKMECTTCHTTLGPKHPTVKGKDL